MGSDAIASAFVGVQAARLQVAAAAKMMKMNAQAEGAIVLVLEAAQGNMRSVANLAAGIGGNLDVTA
jgi:hypothetical protein